MAEGKCWLDPLWCGSDLALRRINLVRRKETGFCRSLNVTFNEAIIYTLPVIFSISREDDDDDGDDGGKS